MWVIKTPWKVAKHGRPSVTIRRAAPEATLSTGLDPKNLSDGYGSPSQSSSGAAPSNTSLAPGGAPPPGAMVGTGDAEAASLTSDKTVTAALSNSADKFASLITDLENAKAARKRSASQQALALKDSLTALEGALGIEVERRAEADAKLSAGLEAGVKALESAHAKFKNAAIANLEQETERRVTADKDVREALEQELKRSSKDNARILGEAEDRLRAMCAALDAQLQEEEKHRRESLADAVAALELRIADEAQKRADDMALREKALEEQLRMLESVQSEALLHATAKLEASLAEEKEMREKAIASTAAELQMTLKAQADTFTLQLTEQSGAFKSSLEALTRNFTQLHDALWEETQGRRDAVEELSTTLLGRLAAVQENVDDEKVARIEQEAVILKRFGEDIVKVSAQLDEERTSRTATITELKADIADLDTKRVSSQERFEAIVDAALDEIRQKIDQVGGNLARFATDDEKWKYVSSMEALALKAAMQHEREQRVSEDEQIVQAINDYTRALQDGLRLLQA